MNKIQIKVPVLSLQKAGLIVGVNWHCTECVTRGDFAKPPQSSSNWYVDSVSLAYIESCVYVKVMHDTGRRAVEDTFLPFFPNDKECLAIGKSGWELFTSPTTEQWSAFLKERFGDARHPACIQLSKVGAQEVFLCGL